MDFTYNNFSQRAQEVQALITTKHHRISQIPLQISKADGYIMGLSLLFIAKYGFFSNPEFPFGRLIPYAGVGPALFFSVVETHVFFQQYPSSDSVELGIVTEGGVRYMVKPNLSMDAAFRYRCVQPSYDVQYNTNFGGLFIIGRIVAQQFSAIFRVNYHF
jgi:outer membrane protein W